jgi:monoamine oxidase
MNEPVSRRRFLHMVGVAGGSAAAYRAAMGLGAMPFVARAQAPDIAPLGSTRRRVVILGAGISGLTAAYELGRRGYDIVILEASHRAGGRNMTLRHGDRIDETGNPQVCEFDDHPDLYLNAGPARIPGSHEALLGYCREFGVALAPFINDNRNAWVQDDAMFGGRRIRNREYLADVRGFVSELAAKAIRPEMLDAPLTREDFRTVMEVLRQFGDLDANLKYTGSARAGFATHLLTAAPDLKKPLPIAELLRSGFVYGMNFGEAEDQSAMMLTPVGGMDNVVKGFLSRVGQYVRLNAPVRAVQVKAKGVDIVYERDGRPAQIHADYCLNCIPIHLMAGIPNNLPKDYVQALSAIPRGKLFKIGLQMKERFWEREGIYGGISWTMQDITQIWYPPHGIHGKKGVLLGAYSFSDDLGEKFARLSAPERLELAIRQGEKVHPGYGTYVETGVSIAWARMNHMLGCGAGWNEELFGRWYALLQAPVGTHYMIGDQISYHAGWQEGAIHSAYHAIEDIDRRERAGAATHA